MVKLKPILTVLSLSAFALNVSATAGDWGHYTNFRFGYGVDVPPGFGKVEESQNSDGGRTRAINGNSELSVWGSHIVTQPNFASEIASRVLQDVNDGWSVTYDRRKSSSASWSGQRAERIFYERAISACEDAAAYFRIEYDAADRKAFDPIIGRLVKSFKVNC